MKQYLYRGQMYNGRELSELTGVKYSTLMARLSRGYTVEEAVTDSPAIPDSIRFFVEHANLFELSGLTSEELYKEYCADLPPTFTRESHTHFMRCMKQVVSHMRIVPSRVLNRNGLPTYKRIVRFD